MNVEVVEEANPNEYETEGRELREVGAGPIGVAR